MNNTVAILHFSPIEGYPPVQNLINIFSLKNEIRMFCLTTGGAFKFRFAPKGINIFRLGKSGRAGNELAVRLHRYLSYFLFNIFGSIILVYKRPQRVLYYETASAFPAIMYKFFFPRTQLFVHYHEYTSLPEYEAGPLINKWLHQLEKRNYKKACWISHTNEKRLEFFADDHQMDINSTLRSVPNYPPESWPGKEIANPTKKLPIKLVYAGFSLDFDSMYIKEVIDFVAENTKFTLDFYLLKRPENIMAYADSLKCNNINWNSEVSYSELPVVLKKYDIGLILYKGLTKNYIYNAPNKLFEYLVCGLEVWCSDKILGVLPYLQHKNSRILWMNFLNISKSLNENVKNELVENNTSSPYTSERALNPLIDKLVNKAC